MAELCAGATAHPRVRLTAGRAPMCYAATKTGVLDAQICGCKRSGESRARLSISSACRRISSTIRSRITARCASMIRCIACRTAPISSRAGAIATRSTATPRRILLRQEDRVSSEIRRHRRCSSTIRTSLVFNDPPLHTHVRRAIQMALSTAGHRRDGGRARSRWSTGCSTRWQRKGRADLIEDFAAAIPVEIIGNLLGVPHADRGPLRGWSLAILGALEPVLTAGADGVSATRRCAIFSAYLKRLTDDRRRKPGDPDKDVLTRLINGEHEGASSPRPSCCRTASSSSMPATRPPPT